MNKRTIAVNLLIVLLLLLSAPASGIGSAPVYLARLTGAITPGNAGFLESAIHKAKAEGAGCLIVMLDTPGGLVESMRKRVMAIYGSSIPVAAYVPPSGARAASAGVMITMAAAVAAMAPGTHIGAAHPVNAVIYFRVIGTIKAIVEVENYTYAISHLAQTTLRSVCGQAELGELLSAREKVNAQLQEILDTHTDPWGIKVATVELKHIDLPTEMQRAKAKQAEA